MRFTLLDPGKKSPSFELGRSRSVFLSIAAAEIALLMLMVLLFIKLRTVVDAPILISVMIIIIGVFTYFARQSTILAQTVLMFCVLALEINLYMDLPPTQLQYYSLKANSTDLLPFIFVAIDIALAWWILARGIRVGEEEKVEEVREVRSIDFEERSRR